MRRDVKQDMMELWRETFHDSMAYIRLVFDTYYNKEYTAVRYEDNGALAASLLGVPFRFVGVDRFEEDLLVPSGKVCIEIERVKRGLYLCGLATRPQYRCRGYMSALMHEIEQRAAGEGFDFTFLIPADDHLADYYGCRGYKPIWRESLDVSEKHQGIDTAIAEIGKQQGGEDFGTSYEVRVVDKMTVDEDLCEEICRLVNEESGEGAYRHFRQQYTIADMKAIIRENRISNGRIYLSFDGDGMLAGVAFLMPKDEAYAGIKIVVQRIAARSKGAIVSLLKCIFGYWKGYRIEIKNSQRLGILDDLRGEGIERHREYYGMVKWLIGEDSVEKEISLSIGLLLD